MSNTLKTIDNTYRPGQRVSLNDLSNEVITLIAQNIRQPFKRLFDYNTSYRVDVTTLLNLVLCSKRLQGLVEPILYEECNERDAAPGKNYHDMQNFLCRLLLRPDLAARVKRVSVQGQRFSNDPFGGIDGRLDVSMITQQDWKRDRRCCEGFDRLSLRWTMGLSLADQERETGSFLRGYVIITSASQEVVCFNWDYDQYDLLNKFLEDAAQDQKDGTIKKIVPFGLGRLEKVTLVYWDTEGCMGPEITFP